MSFLNFLLFDTGNALAFFLMVSQTGLIGASTFVGFSVPAL
jgi:hypothetical protein